MIYSRRHKSATSSPARAVTGTTTSTDGKKDTRAPQGLFIELSNKLSPPCFAGYRPGRRSGLDSKWSFRAST